MILHCVVRSLTVHSKVGGKGSRQEQATVDVVSTAKAAAAPRGVAKKKFFFREEQCLAAAIPMNINSRLQFVTG